jgi:hypothetical protein
MDPRLRLLSYSSLLTLHSCPRKFQLYRLNAIPDEDDPAVATNQNVTFAFGHVVGQGIQDVMAELPESTIYLNAFLGWHADLLDVNEKQQKSFYLALAAIQKFISMRENGYLKDYELLQHNSKPAVELSFNINLPDGFNMRGSVDAVLVHKETGEVMVLECKTSSSANLNAATFKNSAQGIGYSVVLDVICPNISSYKVLYLVYLTKSGEYEQLPFTKSYLQRATWIQELLLDVETIKLYETSGVYPMRGESCYDFYRECEYIQTCTLSTKYLTKPADPEKVYDTKSYDITLTLMDLITGQLKKNEAAEAIRAANTEKLPAYNPDEDELL